MVQPIASRLQTYTVCYVLTTVDTVNALWYVTMAKTSVCEIFQLHNNLKGPLSCTWSVTGPNVIWGT